MSLSFLSNEILMKFPVFQNVIHIKIVIAVFANKWIKCRSNFYKTSNRERNSLIMWEVLVDINKMTWIVFSYLALEI